MNPLLSIIIPVYRESALIGETLARLYRLGIPCPFEIIVSDGEPGHSTLAAILSNAATADMPGCCPVPSPRGRGSQMNQGAARAKGSLLLFLHADTRLDPGGLAALIREFRNRDPNAFCGAFDLAIASPKPHFRVIEKTASLRSRLSRVPYGDQAIFMSRRLFRRINGFDNVPIMEDVGLMLKVRRLGVKPLFLPYPAITSARRWETEGIIFTTLRNWILVSCYYLGASPHRLARFYESP